MMRWSWFQRPLPELPGSVVPECHSVTCQQSAPLICPSMMGPWELVIFLMSPRGWWMPTTESGAVPVMSQPAK